MMAKREDLKLQRCAAPERSEECSQNCEQEQTTPSLSTSSDFARTTGREQQQIQFGCAQELSLQELSMAPKQSLFKITQL